MDITPKDFPIIPLRDKVVLPDNPLESMGESYGGWTAETNALSSGKIRLDAVAERILIGDATEPMTGIGIFQGLDDLGTGYDWRVGNPDGQYARWDASAGTFSVAGAISASTIDIGGADTTSFHVDVDGNLWLGAALFADGPFRVTNAGAATASSITITGGTIGGIAVANVGYVATPTADAVPANLAYSTGGISTGSDGSQSAYVVLTWDAIATNTFDHYLIRFKKAALTYYTYIPSNVNTITIEGLTPNISYNFGVASVNKYGAVSDYSTDIAQTTVADTVAPATVTSISATGGIQYTILEWTHNSESDLASYNIYRSETNDSGTAALIGNCRTNYFVDGGRTGGTTYYYWLKAVDTSGNESAAFSTVRSATPRNVTSDDIVTIAGSKVLIDGLVYLSNWRHGSDLTKIDGGNIYTGSVTTTQLNFTPVQSTDVIAKINASAEGITIDADNLTISAATTFSAGYDPTDKVADVGGTYDSAASGARVRIFPDANTGIQIIDDAAADVFKAIVGGTDVGDVIMGSESAGQYAKWDKSAVKFIVNGSPILNQTHFGDGSDGDIDINSGTFSSGPITNNALTRDAYFDDLTLSGGDLDCAGYRLFVAGTLTVNNTYKVYRNGNAGGDGADNMLNATGGTAGAALAAGTLPGSLAGMAAPNGPGNLNPGAAGNNEANGIGTTGASGGRGGGADHPAAGAGGTVTASANRLRNATQAILFKQDSTAVNGNGGGGSGAAGASGGSGVCGGGGGSGSNGGCILISARKIVVASGGSITANGGAGGAGGDRTATNGYGGGGGAGGSGGVVILIYSTLSNSGTIEAAGGTGGAAGSSFDGDVGDAGATGTAGIVIQLQV